MCDFIHIGHSSDLYLTGYIPIQKLQTVILREVKYTIAKKHLFLCFARTHTCMRWLGECTQ